MRYLLSGPEALEIDRFTIENINIPGIALMERAASQVAEEISRSFNQSSKGLFVVETGNNGGDGLAAARMLFNLGYEVDIFVVGGLSKKTDSFLIQEKILSNLGFVFLDSISEKKYDYVVDGLFGVGLKRDIAGVHKDVITMLNAMTGVKYAIDIPSGINSTTGQIMGVSFKADITITFDYEKLGMVLYPGALYCGEIMISQVGFPQKALEHIAPKHFTYDNQLSRIFPPRRKDSNKGTYKKVAVIAGSENISGAATLAGESAYRMGCGLMKLYTHINNRDIIGTTVPEALLMTYETEVEAVKCAENAMEYGDVILIGPGISTSVKAFAMLKVIMEKCHKPVIIDADGLNLLQGHMELLDNHEGPVVITPHLKEMSRLNKRTIEDIKTNICQVAQEFASKHKVVVVLKDARTVVSSGSDEIYINTTGNDGMSTAGSGDVLAGMVAGMISLGLDVIEGARAAVYFHGACGDYAAKNLGKGYMLARDIIEAAQKINR